MIPHGMCFFQQRHGGAKSVCFNHHCKALWSWPKRYAVDHQRREIHLSQQEVRALENCMRTIRCCEAVFSSNDVRLEAMACTGFNLAAWCLLTLAEIAPYLRLSILESPPKMRTSPVPPPPSDIAIGSSRPNQQLAASHLVVLPPPPSNLAHNRRRRSGMALPPAHRISYTEPICKIC
jgi:hypothetical protein